MWGEFRIVDKLGIFTFIAQTSEECRPSYPDVLYNKNVPSWVVNRFRFNLWACLTRQDPKQAIGTQWLKPNILNTPGEFFVTEVIHVPKEHTVFVLANRQLYRIRLPNLTVELLKVKHTAKVLYNLTKMVYVSEYDVLYLCNDELDILGIQRGYGLASPAINTLGETYAVPWCHIADKLPT